ncbi:hypothetical protein KFU94_07920 [Chloroflexi bacterium TSY]|nr:hypothetical protein [Chloroflexi bacterium TSY]
MGLGNDNTISKTEFVDAMRVRLEAEQSGLGANVDDPSVQENLGALGQAVFRIATVHAETFSDGGTDDAFWQWITDVNAWLSGLATWQQGVAQAFDDWAPTQPAEQALKDKLIAVPSPGSPPMQPPTNLRGKIE